MAANIDNFIPLLFQRNALRWLKIQERAVNEKCLPSDNLERDCNVIFNESAEALLLKCVSVFFENQGKHLKEGDTLMSQFLSENLEAKENTLHWVEGLLDDFVKDCVPKSFEFEVLVESGVIPEDPKRNLSPFCLWLQEKFPVSYSTIIFECFKFLDANACLLCNRLQFFGEKTETELPFWLLRLLGHKKKRVVEPNGILIPTENILKLKVCQECSRSIERVQFRTAVSRDNFRKFHVKHVGKFDWKLFLGCKLTHVKNANNKFFVNTVCFKYLKDRVLDIIPCIRTATQNEVHLALYSLAQKTTFEYLRDLASFLDRKKVCSRRRWINVNELQKFMPIFTRFGFRQRLDLTPEKFQLLSSKLIFHEESCADKTLSICLEHAQLDKMLEKPPKLLFTSKNKKIMKKRIGRKRKCVFDEFLHHPEKRQNCSLHCEVGSDSAE